MLSDKNCKIICIILTIVIVLVLIRAFTNQGKLWGNEYYRSCENECRNPTTTMCLVCQTKQMSQDAIQKIQNKK